MGVNLKVMFSFMVAHAEFGRIAGDRCDVLLWRDPSERAVSTFFDKCRQAARADAAKVQNSQALLLEALGLGALPDLQGVSFVEFVSVLPAIYMQDAHFRPQLDRLQPRQVGSIVDIATGLEAFGQRLGVDFTPRVNATEHDAADAYLTPNTKAVIERLYATDYRALRYRPGSAVSRWFRRSW